MKPSLQSAQAVAALVNLPPSRPRVDECEAVVATVLTPRDGKRDDRTLAALQQKIDEVDRLYEVAKAEPEDERTELDKAITADEQLSALSKRIFASPPTIHNLRLRAVLAR